MGCACASRGIVRSHQWLRHDQTSFERKLAIIITIVVIEIGGKEKEKVGSFI